VRYVEQLRRYHAVFPRENVLVLIYDDLRREKRGDGTQGCCVSSMLTDSVELEMTEANPSVTLRLALVFTP